MAGRDLFKWNDIFELDNNLLDTHKNRITPFLRKKCITMLQVLSSMNTGTNDKSADLIVVDVRRWMKCHPLSIANAAYNASLLWYHHKHTVPYDQSHLAIYLAIEPPSITGYDPNIVKSLIYENLLSLYNPNGSISFRLLDFTPSFATVGKNEVNSNETEIILITERILKDVDTVLYRELSTLELEHIWGIKYGTTLLANVINDDWEHTMISLILFSKGSSIPFRYVILYFIALLMSDAHDKICTKDDSAVMDHTECIRKIIDAEQFRETVASHALSEKALTRVATPTTMRFLKSILRP